MRQTCEIIADLKDGKEVPYEELKMACLVQSSMLFFFKNNTKTLLKGGIEKDLLIQTEYSDSKTSSKEMGIPSWYWKAEKTDPMKWLGKEHIPGTPEWEKMHKVHQKIFDKIMANHKED